MMLPEALIIAVAVLESTIKTLGTEPVTDRERHHLKRLEDARERLAALRDEVRLS